MRASRHSVGLAVLGLLVVLAVTSLFWSGCGKEKSTVAGPDSAVPAVGTVVGEESAAIRAAIGVQERNTKALMAMPNIVGTAVSVADDGTPVLVLYLAEPSKDELPYKIEDLPVVTEVSGYFYSLGTSRVEAGVTANTGKQTPPISLGTSGGWRYDLANGYCCGGTLGSLVTNGTYKYILSNYHVFESDIVNGGNGRISRTGDYIIQPGLIDVSCNAASAQNVATLVVKRSLPNSNVDCSIGQVISGMVQSDGRILGIGTISATTIAPAINMYVKKSGRTSGLTTSSISGINGTVSVQYANECAGGVAFTKTFTGQIMVRNSGSTFLKSGDSGSLMVQNVSTNPKAVGLLFAGSSTTAVANPINAVLSFLGSGFRMVGY